MCRICVGLIKEVLCLINVNLTCSLSYQFNSCKKYCLDLSLQSNINRILLIILCGYACWWWNDYIPQEKKKKEKIYLCTEWFFIPLQKIHFWPSVSTITQAVERLHPVQTLWLVEKGNKGFIAKKGPPVADKPESSLGSHTNKLRGFFFSLQTVWEPLKNLNDSLCPTYIHTYIYTNILQRLHLHLVAEQEETICRKQIAYAIRKTSSGPFMNRNPEFPVDPFCRHRGGFDAQ